MHVHTVLIKLSDPGDRDRCCAEIMRMDGEIDGMVDLTLRVNETGGFFAADIALTTRWVDVDVYSAYVDHPLHRQVRGVILALMSDAASIDYTVEDEEAQLVAA